MQDFIEPDSSDEQLNEAALLDPGEYLLVLKSIDIGTATDKNTGVEYGYWVFIFEVPSGPSKGMQIRQWIGFGADMKNRQLYNRRMTLRSVGIDVQRGQRVSLPDPKSLVGRYVTATISHWTNKDQKVNQQIDDIEAYQQPQGAAPQQQVQVGGGLSGQSPGATAPSGQQVPQEQPPPQQQQPPQQGYVQPDNHDEIPF